MSANQKLVTFESVGSGKGDVLVIPHSSKGAVSVTNFEWKINNLHLSIPINARLGEVKFVAADFGNYQRVAFVCTKDDSRSPTSTYSAIRNIGIKLAAEATHLSDALHFTFVISNADPIELNMPSCIMILHKAFQEFGQNSTIRFSTNDKITYAHLQNVDIDSNYTSLQEAFVSSIQLAATHNSWINALIKDPVYFYELAEGKYKEYLSFEPQDTELFNRLYFDFRSKKIVFSEYIKGFDAFSAECRFLELCGRLVAYIDKNAFNKGKWNEYPDKRTLARSMVRQTDWIANLINFKRVQLNIKELPPSIANALKFLEKPNTELTMLSDNHRRELYNQVLKREYHGSEDLQLLFALFKSIIPPCQNPKNEGAVYSRILYLPEIKELWLNNDKADAEDTADVELAFGDTVIKSGRTSGSIESTLHSDVFSEEDLLNFNSYARSIAKFITHRNTKPPLTIGILAPWGKGKTTLMKMIQKNLREMAGISPPGVRLYSDEVETTYRNLIGFLKQTPKNLLKVSKLRYPTIWFNAWNFQKEEQIWAGLADSIIKQLIEQIPTKIEQEKAWLALNMRRIDTKKIRQDIHYSFLRKIAPAAYFLIIAVLGIFISIFLKIENPAIAPIPVFGPILLGVGWASIVLANLQHQKIEFDLSKYVKQPQYEEKMGYLYAVKEDLKLVLTFLVERDRPAVIFIDDLDRCSPKFTAEIVEAINSFISGDLPHCYFILGQDAQMVAAALDVTYEEVGTQLGSSHKNQGSLGWYFMEKFIQLQFNIPVLKEQDGKKFMAFLLHPKDESSTQLSHEEIAKLDEQLTIVLDKISSSDTEVYVTSEMEELESKLAAIEPEKAKVIRERVVDKAADTYDDNDVEVTNLIEVYGQYLVNSPRTIKRFVNLYRFYRFIQFTGQNKLLQELDSTVIGKWIVIMVRWPQLVRAIQWDTERDMLMGNTSLERAEIVDISVKNAVDFESWVKQMADGRQISWLEDAGLYHFLRKSESGESALRKAVEVGFW